MLCLLFIRSVSNLQSQRSRSVKSLPWYRDPKKIVSNTRYWTVQRGAMLSALFSLVSFLIKFAAYKCFSVSSSFTQFLSVFTVLTALFDLYCLSMAAPGAVHYGYYFISYEFVYVGNRHGKSRIEFNRKKKSSVLRIHFQNIFVSRSSQFAGHVCALLGCCWLCCVRYERDAHGRTSKGTDENCAGETTKLQSEIHSQEHEKQFHPWLIAFGAFCVLRFFAFLFFSIVNDLTFFYNMTMCMAWFFLVGMSFYAWALVYTLYLELRGLTKLEDLAQLRVSKTLLISKLAQSRRKHLLKRNIFAVSDGHTGIAARLNESFHIQLTADHAIHCINTANALIYE